jgi:prepilin-type N-terminal cleavage/methylation domain-containing protein
VHIRLATGVSQLGFGLPEVLVAVALSTVVAMGISSQMKNFSNAARKISSTSDLGSIGSQLTRSVSCERTFAGGTPGNPCAANSFIDLRNDGNTLVLAAGGSMFGAWTVRARCNVAQQSIEVRAARRTPGAPIVNFPVSGGQYNAAHYVSDEVGGVNRDVPGRQLRYDWEHPKSLLIPLGPGGLCSDWFAAPSSPTAQRCAPGTILVGFDGLRKIATCQPFATCNGDNAPKYRNGQWVCEQAETTATLNTIMDNRINAVQRQPAINIANQQITTLVPGMITTRITNNNNSFVLPRDTTTITNANSFTQNKFNYMGSGPTITYTESDDSDCANWGRMSCPTGYYAYGFEFRMPSSGNNCRIMCRRIQE